MEMERKCLPHHDPLTLYSTFYVWSSISFDVAPLISIMISCCEAVEKINRASGKLKCYTWPRPATDDVVAIITCAPFCNDQ